MSTTVAGNDITSEERLDNGGGREEEEREGGGRGEKGRERGEEEGNRRKTVETWDKDERREEENEVGQEAEGESERNDGEGREGVDVGDARREEREELNGRKNMESRNSSIDGTDLECSSNDLRPPLDRPLGSRDPTPPILLAPEDDDRLVGNTETGFRAAGSGHDEEGGPGSHDPGTESHDSKIGGSEELDSPATTSPAASPLHCGDLHDGFIFAIHRKIVSLCHTTHT